MIPEQVIALIDDEEDIHDHALDWVKSYHREANKTPGGAKPKFDFQVFSNLDSFTRFLNDQRASKASSKITALLDLNFNGNRRASIDFINQTKLASEAINPNSEEAGSRCLNIIVYSSSDSPDDISNCYRNGADSYVCKGKPAGQKQRFHALLDHCLINQTVATLP